MQEIPNNYHYLLAKKDRTNEAHLLTLRNFNNIEATNCLKLLGTHIDPKLDFKEHSAALSRRTGRQLNVFTRIAGSLNVKSRLESYRSFVWANFTYCPLEWLGHSVTQMRNVEKLQETLRIVYHDFNSTLL